MTLAYEAMMFAKEKHKDQKRKYTGEPYAAHLAEVAGILATVTITHDTGTAIAWLHDCVEDQGVTRDELEKRFGPVIAIAVMMLSDLETGNRATRKALSRARLAAAPGWIQTIKVADLISNTASIVTHDPQFAVVYLDEKRKLLDVLVNADERLLRIARGQVEQGLERLAVAA